MATETTNETAGIQPEIKAQAEEMSERNGIPKTPSASHRIPILLAFLPLLVVTIFDIVAMTLSGDRLSDHSGLCMCPLCASFYIAAIAAPFLFMLFDHHE